MVSFIRRAFICENYFEKETFLETVGAYGITFTMCINLVMSKRPGLLLHSKLHSDWTLTIIFKNQFSEKNLTN